MEDLKAQFVLWASKKEIDFENNSTVDDAYNDAMIYAQGMQEYLPEFQYIALLNNLWLHYFICNEDNSVLYCKYHIRDKEWMLSSASSGNSSTSTLDISSFSKGEFMLEDFFRTPYGRKAYSMMESLKGLVIGLQ